MIDQHVERLTPVLLPPAEWGFGDALPAETFAGMSEDAMLSELEKHERLTAWLAGRGVALTEALTRSREKSALERLDAEQPDASARARNLVKAEVRACIDHEVELATGLPSSVARTRTKIAIGDPVRFGPVRQALSRGELSWQRAWHLVRATEEAPAEAIEKIVASVIAPYPARSADGLGGLLVPQSVFTSRLRYQLAKVTTPRERHEQGVENRCTMTMLDPDRGTGEVRITGHAGRVAGAHERVDAIARRLRKEGDRRTLAQLRSDIALDLMLFGQLPRQGDLLDPHTGQHRQEDPAAMDAALAAYGTFDGELPPARVDVVIPLSALMGLSETPGMVACAGEQEWLAAAFVRDMAFAAGSVWRRLVTDPVTGHMVDLHVKGYAVTGDLRERVMARDRVSRVPGSMRPAQGCDTDHDIDYAAGGETRESNASAKDRRGHNHKTRRMWTSMREPKVVGDIWWTTGAGRVYVSSPWDYRDPDPPTTEQMRENLDREQRRWAGENVDPTPPIAPDEDDWMLHDLDLIEPPTPRQSYADPGVELVGEVENYLAMLLEDAQETPPVIITPPTPEPPPPPEPKRPIGWDVEDPGPPPF